MPGMQCAIIRRSLDITGTRKIPSMHLKRPEAEKSVVSVTLPIPTRFWHMMKKPVASGWLVVVTTAIAATFRLWLLDITAIGIMTSSTAWGGLCITDVAT